MKLEYIVKSDNLYKNVNEVLLHEFKFSNRLLVKVIKNNCVYLNNQLCNTRSTIKKEDIITVDLGYEEDNSNIIPTKMNLNIVYEDEWLLILNKPAGIAIHPSCQHFDNSLFNGLSYYFNLIGLKKKIRPINRLDFHTSGLCVFAKCEYIQEMLSKEMISHDFVKEYTCIVEGFLSSKEGQLSFPIARKPSSIIEREVPADGHGQMSITNYRVLKEFKDNNGNKYSLVRCVLETGRTHQIRVHFSHIGHPLLGDSLYGNASVLVPGQALCCTKLSFFHPISNEEICFEIPFPVSYILHFT